jgi:ribosomal protein S12 methylthiotransferase
MKILFVSLGCDKNLVDSEMMLGMLVQKGYTITDDENEADIVVVNTCCFIGDAKQESINTLLEMAELKKSGNIKALVADALHSVIERKSKRKSQRLTP